MEGIASEGSPKVQVHSSACALDCPDGCSLEVTVTDGRVTKIEGTHVNPVTDGYICKKVRRFDRHMYGDDRLLQPAVRRGPRGEANFEPVSWDDALDLIAQNLLRIQKEHGGESILPFYYGGSNGFLTQGATDARLFRRLGASRLALTVCAAPSGSAATGLYGKMPGVAPQDFPEANLIVVWGVNPSASGIHQVPPILEAKKRGARLIVIDPRRTPLAKQADLHLAVRPGGDLPLAMAVIRYLFEENGADLEFLKANATGWEELRQRAQPWTFERAAEAAGVAAADIEILAKDYVEASPALIRCGWGLERNRNGGSAVAAVLALPAVANKFGVRGGGYIMSNSKAWELPSIAGADETKTRLINMNLLGETLLEADPAVHGLFVYNCNPLATLPEQNKVRAGLERDDLFTVVFDQVMTDTALYADVILPATTFLEHREVRNGYGAMVLQDAEAVIEPVGESRSNYDVFSDLIRRLDLDEEGDAVTADDLTNALLAPEIRQRLDEDGIAMAFGDGRPVQLVDIHPATPDGKIHLCPPELDAEAPDGLYAFRDDPATDEYPLALISPATNRTVSSTFGQLLDEAKVDLHPDDASARGISTGDPVRVWNDLGEVRLQARVSSDLRPGVAFLPKGIWCRSTASGTTSNALCSTALTDLGAGATFNDARVEIARVDRL